ncbi:MAG: benzoate-CoA ligase family protein [Alphaproteobacteria bacterium]|nr:benzoate-CoA ligase family protein [Alphaproteobacteria bacterium]MDE2352438.1 benzoate-CoA ligase family protein [Alphaproteobacteria bacterium]
MTSSCYNAAVDFLERNISQGRSDKIAFIDPERSITYGQLADAASRVGPMLARLGIERENRIALVLNDTTEFPILYWGAIRAGIVPVLLNTRLTAEQYHYLFEDSRAKAVFASSSLLPAIREAAAGVPTLKTVVTVGSGPSPRLADLLNGEPAGAEPATTCADEVAFWLYSSGTTGHPKGTMHIHSTPMFVAQNAGVQWLGYREDDVIFSAAKMFFAYGLSNAMLCPTAVGATTVLYPERPTPKAVFEMLNTHQPTIFFAVPTLYAAMLADADCARLSMPKRLRLCVSAGEPLPGPTGQAWKERFGVDIVNGVGATELCHIFIANRPGAVEYGTSGVAVDGYRLKLVDECEGEVADGEIGELWVSGGSGAIGYWNQRAKSQRTFVGEWIRTGDKYMKRPDGTYVYCGRSDDMFKVSGIWVSPFEVEAALVAHPKVLEAAVIPAADRTGLIKPKAFVVLKDAFRQEAEDCLYEELKRHVKEAVGPWKYPRWVEFVESLPKTATGKIRRVELREQRS